MLGVSRVYHVSSYVTRSYYVSSVIERRLFYRIQKSKYIASHSTLTAE